MIFRTIAVFFATASPGLACTDISPDVIPLRSELDNAPAAYAEMGSPPVSAPFTLKVVVCDRQVSDLAFDALMPAHQHGMNFDAEVAKSGATEFTVSNVVFHMPGLWELQIEAVTDHNSHNYTAKVELE